MICMGNRLRGLQGEKTTQRKDYTEETTQRRDYTEKRLHREETTQRRDYTEGGLHTTRRRNYMERD